MPKITSVKAREIIDSRGNPTVEVELAIGKHMAVASVPSGASTGIHEALELRDKDPKRYNGAGVLTAVANVNGEIAKAIKGMDFDQKKLDMMLIQLDGTANKARLGANAILGISLAFAKAAAMEKGVELYEYIGSLAKNKKFALPQPMLNVINGGKHADSGLDIQEFMLGPVGFTSFARKIQAGAEVITALKKLLHKAGYTVSVGDEGGFAPQLKSNEEAFDFLTKSIAAAGYTTKEVQIGVDAAASSFYENGKYMITNAGKKTAMNAADMIAWYEELVKKYPIISIEDGLEEEDWKGFADMTKKLGNKIKIVGDDLLVTNVKRVEMAIKNKSVNSVLIKLNQIGSLSETVDTIMLTKKQGWVPFVSHRSGETTDTFIADLAVGLSCEFIKAGSLTRGERVCKYNRLMEIEEMLVRK